MLSDHRKHSDPFRPRTNPIAEYDAGYDRGWLDGFGVAVGVGLCAFLAVLIYVGCR